MFTDDYDTNEYQSITLRLNHNERAQIDELMALTGESTQHLAIMRAIEEYPKLLVRIENIKTESNDLLEAMTGAERSWEEIARGRKRLAHLLAPEGTVDDFIVRCPEDRAAQ